MKDQLNIWQAMKGAGCWLLSAGIPPIVTVAHDILATDAFEIAFGPWKCDRDTHQAIILLWATIEEAAECLNHEVCVQRDCFRSLAVRRGENLYLLLAIYRDVKTGSLLAASSQKSESLSGNQTR